MKQETSIETLEQVADRIIDRAWWHIPINEARTTLRDAILLALRNERERAARTAETGVCVCPFDTKEFPHQSNCPISIADAIRKGDR